MAQRLRIRAASPDDAQAIGRIHVQTWQDTYAGLLPDRYLLSLNPSEKAIDWIRGLERAEGREGTFVATLNGDPVGFVAIGNARGAGGSVEGEIYAIYVATDWQGNGVGRALLTRSLERLAGQGHGAAVVWVLAGNPARFFYEAMGAQLAGSRVELFAGAKVEELRYRWPDLKATVAGLKQA